MSRENESKSPVQSRPLHASPAEQGSSSPITDPERWVDLYGDYLFKYAIMRVRDASRAEDLVQETFLAALKARKNFAGRSAEGSWLVGILKNKICDHFRKASRETSFTDLEFFANEEAGQFVPGGGAQGEWVKEAGPRQWPEPGANLDNEVFWQTFHDCSRKLPKNVAAAFNLREVDGIESKDVCAILNISENNLWVMLHRARMALRRCLETNWFGKRGAAL